MVEGVARETDLEGNNGKAEMIMIELGEHSAAQAWGQMHVYKFKTTRISYTHSLSLGNTNQRQRGSWSPHNSIFWQIWSEGGSSN